MSYTTDQYEANMNFRLAIAARLLGASIEHPGYLSIQQNSLVNRFDFSFGIDNCALVGDWGYIDQNGDTDSHDRQSVSENEMDVLELKNDTTPGDMVNWIIARMEKVMTAPHVPSFALDFGRSVHESAQRTGL